MRLNEYIVEVVMQQQQFGMIIISVKEENADLALNKVQGMLNFKDEWIHLDDAQGNKYRIKSNQISYLRLLVQPKVMV